MNRQRWVGHAALICVIIVWGLSFISTKIILESGVPAMTLAAIRFTLAALIMLPALRLREPGFRVTRALLWPAFFSGLVGVTLYFVFENFGLQYTTASTASLIIACIPAVTLLAAVLRGERLRPAQWIGALCSIGGVALVVGSSAGGLLGNMLMVGACLCWVVFNRISLHVMGKCSSFAASTLQNAAGAITLLPLSLIEYRQWVPLTPIAWLHMGFLVVFCSVAGYFLYNSGLQRIGPVSATVYLNLMPLVGAVGGVVALNESLSIWQMVGGVVLIASVFIATLAGRRPSDGELSTQHNSASEA